MLPKRLLPILALVLRLKITARPLALVLCYRWKNVANNPLNSAREKEKSLRQAHATYVATLLMFRRNLQRMDRLKMFRKVAKKSRRRPMISLLSRPTIRRS